MTGTYTQNLYNVLAHWFMSKPGNEVQAITKTDGTSASLPYLRGSSTSYDVEIRPDLKAPAGDVTYGILAGTGITAADPSDHTMENIILHGDTDGILNYDEVKLDAFNQNPDGSFDLLISRFFTNNGAVDVTIKEIGVVMKAPYSYNSYMNTMIYREVLDTPITVAAGGSIRYRTTLKLATGFA